MKFPISKFITNYFNWDVSSFLKPKTEHKELKYVFVEEANHYRIPTYPRFIINNLSIKEEELKIISSIFDRQRSNQNIFNSSDFLEINKAFGTIKPNYGQILLIGKNLKLFKTEYKIININISIADYFNDYSFTAFEKQKTKVGKPTPYNIVIEIDIEDIKN